MGVVEDIGEPLNCCDSRVEVNELLHPTVNVSRYEVVAGHTGMVYGDVQQLWVVQGPWWLCVVDRLQLLTKHSSL